VSELPNCEKRAGGGRRREIKYLMIEISRFHNSVVICFRMKIEPWDTDRERRICYKPLGGMHFMDTLVEGNEAGVSMPSVSQKI